MQKQNFVMRNVNNLNSEWTVSDCFFNELTFSYIDDFYRHCSVSRTLRSLAQLVSQ